MSIPALPTTLAATIVFAWTLSGIAPPAVAGKACIRAGLSSPCVSSSDLKARLNLDEDGKNGRLRVRDADGEDGVELDAGSGNVTNLFSNDEDESNGLVKAWAEINADGTVANCWRCDPGATSRTAAGVYVVDFTPLATDITGRPRSVTISGDGVVPLATARTADVDGDASALNVGTNNPTTGANLDAPFILIVY